ncbi:MAG: hypothetical protein WCK63_04970 [Betaproteobacteria bacterium]
MENTDKTVDRETLYNEVWTDPVAIVAPRYGLSDVGLAKICRNLAIPLPSRGYWAKVKAGCIMSRAPLPKSKHLAPVGTGLVKPSPEKAAAREAIRQSAAKARRETPPMTHSAEPPSALHALVRAASKRLHQRDGWTEDTGLRSAPKEVLNLSVTRESLDRALGIVDAVLKALAKQGFEFEVDGERGVTTLKWIETGTTLNFALTEHIGRASHVITPAEERARKRYWDRYRVDGSVSFPHLPMYDYTATGKLSIKVGHWPARTWNDTPRTQLEQRLKEITGGIVSLAQETHAKEIEEARRKEAYRRAVEHYELQTKRRADEIERFKEFEASAKEWERAAKLRTFANAVEADAKAAGGLSHEQVAWLAWARAKADWLDPLILVSDLILDAPEPKRPSYW